jgi:hypothetical protein
MSEALLTRHTVSRVMGAARLLKLIRAGWLTPCQRTPNRVFYRASDIHLVLRRLERGERPPPDHIESLRTNRNYVKKSPPPKPPGLDELKLDFTEFDLTHTHV